MERQETDQTSRRDGNCLPHNRSHLQLCLQPERDGSGGRELVMLSHRCVPGRARSITRIPADKPGKGDGCPWETGNSARPRLGTVYTGVLYTVYSNNNHKITWAAGASTTAFFSTWAHFTLFSLSPVPCLPPTVYYSAVLRIAWARDFLRRTGRGARTSRPRFAHSPTSSPPSALLIT
jgi:hypothetical protein